jgi:hypothetical protein
MRVELGVVGFAGFFNRHVKASRENAQSSGG